MTPSPASTSMLSTDETVEPASMAMLSADKELGNSSTGSNDSSCSTASNTVIASSNNDNRNGPVVREPICRPWSQGTAVLHNFIRRFVVVFSGHAARNPMSCIFGITILACAILAAGLFTNFVVEVDYDIIYAPRNSRPTEHMNWVIDEAGFPAGDRPFTVLIHNNGNNVMSKRGVQQLFEVFGVLKNTPGYSELCAQSGFFMDYPNGTEVIDSCNIIGSTRFWYYDQAFFQEQEKTDRQLMETISNETYPDGIPVNHDFILGNYNRTNRTSFNNPMEANAFITHAESFIETLLVPDVEGAEEWELAAIDNLLQLQETWKAAAQAEIVSGQEAQTMQVEFFTLVSYSTEFQRAILKDIPLTLLVAVIMVGFTCIVFFKRDKIQSRSLLGISSVYTITMSVFMGHGLMFLLGVPFTNMTMMLPFVIYGVGLDDTFIITGAYFRTDPKKETVARIEETMEEVGLSISLTTITTMFAFGMGYLSSIPAIQWLCLYAFVTIGFDFLFQIALFVSFIVIDERRVQANRRDMCFCIKVEEEEDNGSIDDHAKRKSSDEDQPDITLRFMTWYANFLMRPCTKVVVLAVFTAFCGFCVYSTSLLTQEFIISDFLPAESYVADYLDSIGDFADEMVPLGIYFRHLNQSDAEVQEQMRDYVDDLMELEQLDVAPPVCWVRDFHDMNFTALDVGIDLDLLSFNDQLTLAMTDPRVKEVYGNDIVRDENTGDVVSSRCTVFVRNIDLDVVKSQVEMLNDQRAITAVQPLNQGKADWSIFTFTDMYFLWEFYSVAVDELIYTTIFGVLAVTIVAFVLMPHWTAVFFVFPTICVLYVDLLGTLQLAGLHINAVTYVCLTVSIGLLVDFIMHVLLRYYESQEETREEKVKDTLKTMGVSILIGGLSTFLAVIPLAFSTSDIIGTVFTAFFAMITLGVAHGLIFLPVVLSMIGPNITHVNSGSEKVGAVKQETEEPSCPSGVSRNIEDDNFVEICV